MSWEAQEAQHMDETWLFYLRFCNQNRIIVGHIIQSNMYLYAKIQTIEKEIEKFLQNQKQYHKKMSTKDLIKRYNTLKKLKHV